MERIESQICLRKGGGFAKVAVNRPADGAAWGRDGDIPDSKGRGLGFDLRQVPAINTV